MMDMRRPSAPLKTRRWLSLVLVALVLALLAFVAWATLIPPPMPDAQVAVQSDAQVQVETRPWLIFRPTDRQPTAGLILYPGGRVDPRAYAPAARAIAAQGYFVAIVPMPLNLAVFGAGRAQAVIDAYPTVKHWAIGGHSLGGAMAAQFARRHPVQIQGLVLWAAYPSGSDDLSNASLRVASISGTRDGLSTPAKIGASHSLLPSDTQWTVIEGGNHAQFGWYGPQAGDNEASISQAEQQRLVVEATTELLRWALGAP
jgi:poly(3-hydroxybutyrate) depolymerase